MHASFMPHSNLLRSIEMPYMADRAFAQMSSYTANLMPSVALLFCPTCISVVTDSKSLAGSKYSGGATHRSNTDVCSRADERMHS